MPLNKQLKFHNTTRTIRSVFSENGKFYPQLLGWVSIKMLQYQEIDVSRGIEINKTSASKQCELCHYWFF